LASKTRRRRPEQHADEIALEDGAQRSSRLRSVMSTDGHRAREAPSEDAAGRSMTDVDRTRPCEAAEPTSIRCPFERD
jgi:hypothetical protein